MEEKEFNLKESIQEKYDNKIKEYEKRLKVLEEKAENNWKEREEDDKYWSGVVEKKDNEIRILKKQISSLKQQVKLAIERKNWWKRKK